MLQEQTKVDTWSNQDNLQFYKRKSLMLAALAEKVGLTGLPDLEAIEPHLQKGDHILDCGCGYGRVTTALAQKGLTIDAIDVNAEFCNHLRQHLGGYKKVTVIHSDLLSYTPQQQYQKILSLWSGISDFNPSEQQRFFHQLAAWLAPNGLIFIDTLIHHLPASQQINGTSQHYIIEDADGGFIYGYKPTPDEITHYAYNAGLQVYQHIIYDSGVKPRNLFMIGF